MNSHPGTRVVSRAIPGDWTCPYRARAEITAAALQECTVLLPIETWQDGAEQFAVAVDSVPGVLEISVCTAIDHLEVAMRVPARARSAAETVVDRIRERVLARSPIGAGRLKAESTDELPF